MAPIMAIAVSAYFYTFESHFSPRGPSPISPEERERIVDVIEELEGTLRDSSDTEKSGGAGAIYLAEGRYEEAIRAFKRAIDGEPDLSAHHYHLGRAYLGIDRTSEAIEAFQDAVALDPDHEMAHWHLGVLYADRGEYERAAAEYEEVIRINPDHGDARDRLLELRKRQGK